MVLWPGQALAFGWCACFPQLANPHFTVPTIPLLERISLALDADLIVEIAPHAA
jgi:hypothetical protein